MAKDRTQTKDLDFNVADAQTYDSAQLCVLMDIRDELKRLNNVFHCQNFLEVPRILRQIRRNTTKKRKK